MATHSSILAWKTPWTEESGGLHSMGSQRVRHDWSNLALTYMIVMVNCGLRKAFSYLPVNPSPYWTSVWGCELHRCFWLTPVIWLFPLPPFFPLAAALSVCILEAHPLLICPPTHSSHHMRKDGCRKLVRGEFISSSLDVISESHSGQVLSLKGKILLHKKLWTHFKTVYIPPPPPPLAHCHLLSSPLPEPPGYLSPSLLWDPGG